jgi:hypothetical protein
MISHMLALLESKSPFIRRVAEEERRRKGKRKEGEEERMR